MQHPRREHEPLTLPHSSSDGLTLRQGKMLIKLVDRECNQTGYDLIVVFRGKFRAGFYQAFAALFGASLKSSYDPDGDDAELEEIIWLVENDIL